MSLLLLPLSLLHLFILIIIFIFIFFFIFFFLLLSLLVNCPAGDDPDVRCTFDLCTNPLFGDQLCCATCSRPRPRPRPTMSGGGEIVVTQSVGIISLNPTQSVMGFSSQTRRLEPTQFVLFSYVESEQSVL